MLFASARDIRFVMQLPSSSTRKGPLLSSERDLREIAWNTVPHATPSSTKACSSHDEVLAASWSLPPVVCGLGRQLALGQGVHMAQAHIAGRCVGSGRGFVCVQTKTKVDNCRQRSRAFERAAQRPV